jgi:hypothetical protein
VNIKDVLVQVAIERKIRVQNSSMYQQNYDLEEQLLHGPFLKMKYIKIQELQICVSLEGLTSG